jgi:hypothetical protein
MNKERRVEILAFAVAIIAVVAAMTWFPGLASDPSALEARWKPAASNTDRDVELQDAVTNWRTELAHVVDSLYLDAALPSSDDKAATRLRARARDLEAVRGQLASRAHKLGSHAGFVRIDPVETARLAVLLATSVEQTPEASAEVARTTLARVEAILPAATRLAHVQNHGAELLARRDAGSDADEAAGP